jgi:competence protein ComEA
MKKILDNLLTADEQKVILFILFFAFVGLLTSYTGLTASNESPVIDSLKVKEDIEIKFDLKTVTKEELMSIPGIGEKRAAEIIQYREENSLKSRNDLLNIKGIGEVSLRKIKDWFYEMEGEQRSVSDSEISVEIKDDKLLNLNLNSASLEELCQLKGIGPAKAEKIIILREELGEFTNVDDLLKVKGIGIKTLDKIRSNINLGE